MKRKELKKAFSNRERLFGGWISYDHSSIAETFALSGFDFIAIDMEHTPISLASAQRIITISQGHNIPCLPRPVSHSNNYFKPILDSGSDGLIVQMVNNYAQTENISKFIKYPPLGERTYGVNRAHSYGLDFDGYIKSWNEESILIIQIESKEGVDNIEEITTHPSVDGVMIGPYDLSGSYGIPGDINNKIIEKASIKVIEACKKHGKSCGTQISEVNLQNTRNAFNLGYTFVIMGSDLFAITKWAKDTKNLMLDFKT